MRTADIVRIVHKVTSRQRARLNTMISRIVIDAVTESVGIQQLSIEALKDEKHDTIEHMQPGGLSHVALPGAEGVLLCVGGSREVAFALGVANRDQRPKDLSPGETALYVALPAPLGGKKVYCKLDGVTLLGLDSAAQSALRGDELLTKLETLTDALAVLIVALVPTTGVAPGAQAVYAAADAAWKAFLAIPPATPPAPDTGAKSGYIKIP